MSTLSVTAPQEISTVSGPTHFLIRRLHSLTGVLFGGYIVVHLLVNATLVEGSRHDGVATVYQQQVDKIHSLPFLWAISWTIILLPIIYHTIYGIYITLGGQPNLASYNYPRNWSYTLQRVSALVLVFFIAFHYLTFTGTFGGDLGSRLTFVAVDDPSTPFSEATQSTINHLQAAWWVSYVIYPLGILAATFHLANGFWAAGVTWGLAVTAKSQRRWGAITVLLFLFTTACGFTALIAALTSEVRHVPAQFKAHEKPEAAWVAPVSPGARS